MRQPYFLPRRGTLSGRPHFSVRHLIRAAREGGFGDGHRLSWTSRAASFFRELGFVARAWLQCSGSELLRWWSSTSRISRAYTETRPVENIPGGRVAPAHGFASRPHPRGFEEVGRNAERWSRGPKERQCASRERRMREHADHAPCDKSCQALM